MNKIKKLAVSGAAMAVVLGGATGAWAHNGAGAAPTKPAVVVPVANDAAGAADVPRLPASQFPGAVAGNTASTNGSDGAATEQDKAAEKKAKQDAKAARKAEHDKQKADRKAAKGDGDVESADDQADQKNDGDVESADDQKDQAGDHQSGDQQADGEQNDATEQQGDSHGSSSDSGTKQHDQHGDQQGGND